MVYPETVLRCSTCNAPYGRLQNGVLIVDSRHHGEVHRNVVAVSELARLVQESQLDTRIIWRRMEEERLVMTAHGLSVQCACGELVPVVSEFGSDICRSCGRRYRLRVQCGRPAEEIETK